LIKLEDFADEFYDPDHGGDKNIDLTWKICTIAAEDLVAKIEGDETISDYKKLSLCRLQFEVMQWVFSVGRLELELSDEVMDSVFTNWFAFTTMLLVIDLLLLGEVEQRVAKQKLERWFESAVADVL
jgi:hypothetical protein